MPQHWIIHTYKLKSEIHLYTFKPQPLLLQKGTLVDYFFSYVYAHCPQ